MKKLTILMLIIILSFTFVIYNDFALAAEDARYEILVSTYAPMDEFISSQNTMIRWYGEDLNVNLYWAPTAVNITGETQVANAMSILQTRKIDGILLNSPSAKPTKTITDYAKENNIPVIGFQDPSDSPDLLMYVGTVPNIHGRKCGEAMKEQLIKKYGEVKGTIFIVDTTPASVGHHARTLGFMDVFKDEENVTIVREEVQNITLAATKEKVTSYLELGKDFDAGWGPSGAMAKGIMLALEDYEGMEPSDKVLVGSEAYSDVMEGLRNGDMKAVVAPAAAYQGTIALKLLVNYLDGKPLPSVGETINEFSLEDGKPRGDFNPFSDEYIDKAYLPVKITTIQDAISGYEGIEEYYTYDYPFFQQNIPVLTQENADAPWAWGNFPYTWEDELRKAN